MSKKLTVEEEKLITECVECMRAYFPPEGLDDYAHAFLQLEEAICEFAEMRKLENGEYLWGRLVPHMMGEFISNVEDGIYDEDEEQEDDEE